MNFVLGLPLITSPPDNFTEENAARHRAELKAAGADEEVNAAVTGEVVVEDDEYPEDAITAGICECLSATGIHDHFQSAEERYRARKKAEKEKDEAKRKQEEAKRSKERYFFFRLTSIKVTFENKIDNAFLELMVGGQTVERESEFAIEKEVIKKKKDKDGNEIEVVEKVQEYKKQTQILRGFARRFYTRCKKNIKAKETETYTGQSFTGYWLGTYQQLALENLEVRVWNRRPYGANELVGRAAEPLVDIAEGKIDREMFIYAKGGASRHEVAVVVQLSCEFQETFDFRITFKDWKHDPLGVPDTTVDENIPEYLRNEEADEEKREQFAEDIVKKQKTKLTFELRTKPSLWSRMRRGQLFMDLTTTSLNLKASYVKPGEIGTLGFFGTRSWLEDENMTLELREVKRVAGLTIFSKLIARKVVTLRGVLDHGYMLAHLDPVDEDAFKPRKFEVKDKKKKGSGPCLSCFSCLSCLPCCKRGAGDEEEDGADGDGDNGDDAADDKPAQLKPLTVQGVVGTSETPLYRQQGNSGKPAGASASSETYLVVKVIRAKGLQSQDEYKEAINPSVAVEWVGVRKQTRVVPRNSEPFWDESIYFKIPDVTSDDAPSKIDDFGPVARNSTLSLAVWDHDGLQKSPLGFAEVEFEKIYQLRTEQRFEDPDEVEPLQKYAYRTKRDLILPSTTVLEEDHMVQPDVSLRSEESKNPNRHIEFLVYFDRLDGAEIGPPVFNKSGKELLEVDQSNPFKVKPTDTRDPTPMYAESQVRSQAFWNESLANAPHREERFFAFMGKDEYTGGIHFLPTFVKPMHPPTDIQRPDRLFYFVYCLERVNRPLPEEMTEPENLVLRRKMPHVWVWSDPFFFMEKKRGDVKDHALLLCNFLLGLHFDAYVCIGKVRLPRHKRKQKPRPHVWVMTIEDEEGDNAFDADGNRRKLVRFWETTNNRHYVIPQDEDNDRFRCEEKERDSDVEREEAERVEAEKQREREEYVAKKRMQRMADGAGSDTDAGTDADDQSPRSNAPLTAVQGEMDQREMDAEILQDQLLEYVNAAADDVESVPLKGDPASEARRSLVASERQRQAHVRHLQKPLRFKKLKEIYDEQGSLTPYATIDVVFNHKHLYANQQNPNPELIRYDFRDRNRWLTFNRRIWSEFLHTSVIRPFYADTTFQSLPAAPADIEMLQQKIIDRIQGSITSHRLYEVSAEAEFYSSFLFASGSEDAQSYILTRLKFEEENKSNPELAHINLDEEERAARAAQVANGEQVDEWDIESKRQFWVDRILESLDSETRYEERVIHFKHSDPNRVSDGVVEQCKHLIELPAEAQPMFAIGCKIERLPALVSPATVFFCVTYQSDAVDEEY